MMLASLLHLMLASLLHQATNALNHPQNCDTLPGCQNCTTTPPLATVNHTCHTPKGSTFTISTRPKSIVVKCHGLADVAELEVSLESHIPRQILFLDQCHIDSEAQVAHVLSLLGSQTLTALGLNHMPKIQGRYFASSKIVHLEMKFLDFRNVDEDALTYFPSLQNLILDTNRLNIDGRFFERSKELRKIYFKDNDVAALRPGVFRNLSRLKVLTMDGNNMTSLGKSFFEGLSDLELLELIGSGLQSLDPDVFRPLGNLKQLKIIFNNITVLPLGLFRANKGLEYLGIRNVDEALEHTVDIPRDFFRSIAMLQQLALVKVGKLVLHDDIFACLGAMKLLALTGNQISRLASTMFPQSSTLTHLYFSQNNLTKLSQ